MTRHLFTACYLITFGGTNRLKEIGLSFNQNQALSGFSDAVATSDPC